MTQPCFAQYSCKRRISAWKLKAVAARAAIIASTRPRTIGAAARMRAARRHIDAAGGALRRRRGAGAAALDLFLERAPDGFDALGVFPAVPDDGHDEGKHHQLAE